MATTDRDRSTLPARLLRRAGHGQRQPSLVEVMVGDYLCSERDLYRIEELAGDHAVLEECRTENLVVVSLRELITLRRVRPA